MSLAIYERRAMHHHTCASTQWAGMVLLDASRLCMWMHRTVQDKVHIYTHKEINDSQQRFPSALCAGTHLVVCGVASDFVNSVYKHHLLQLNLIKTGTKHRTAGNRGLIMTSLAFNISFLAVLFSTVKVTYCIFKWSVLTTFGWIVMKCGADIHGAWCPEDKS